MTKHHFPTQPVRVLPTSLPRPVRHPPPPKALAKEEQELWSSILQEYRIEGDAVLAVLHKAMNAHETERTCMEILGREGYTILVKGQPRAHPLLKAASEARNSFLACLRALGIDLGPQK
jgi:P27 family predicted phage terminase small subunit